MNQKSRDIVKKIVYLRKSNNIKPEHLAFLLKITEDEYKKIERGSGEITLSQVLQIAEIFKIEAARLFDEIESITHLNIPQGITEINFKITVKSQDPIDIESEIAKQFGLYKPAPNEQIIKKSGLARRRW